MLDTPKPISPLRQRMIDALRPLFKELSRQPAPR